MIAGRCANCMLIVGIELTIGWKPMGYY